MPRNRFRFFPKVLLVIAVAVVIGYLVRSLWLPVFGNALVHVDTAVKADIAIVLGGDSNGYRIKKAGDLVRQGYVPAALISGPEGFYGFNESDVAIPFAVKQGYPAAYFIGFPNDTHSTREEATAILGEMRRRNVRSFLLVTSDYHTARARRIYLAQGKAMGYTPEMYVVAAPDRYFCAATWWTNRESQKTTFFEWTKTIATALGN